MKKALKFLLAAAGALAALYLLAYTSSVCYLL